MYLVSIPHSRAELLWALKMANCAYTDCFHTGRRTRQAEPVSKHYIKVNGSFPQDSEALEKGLGSPGVGVAMFIAGVPMGVLPGVRTGVLPPIWLAGVSSHRDFLLLAPGVGVSPMESPPLSVRGVSAQPLPCPGVSKEKTKQLLQKELEKPIFSIYTNQPVNKHTRLK